MRSQYQSKANPGGSAGGERRGPQSPWQILRGGRKGVSSTAVVPHDSGITLTAPLVFSKNADTLGGEIIKT